MVNMTLALPNDLHKKMKQHPEIKWSEVARQAIKEQARKLDLLDTITQKSSLTKSDAQDISKSIKKNIRKRHGL